MALFWLFTGACGAFNTYVNPLGMDAFGWKFYFFYVAWIIIEFVVIYVFFIEVTMCPPFWLLMRALVLTGGTDERTKSGAGGASLRWQGC